MTSLVSTAHAQMMSEDEAALDFLSSSFDPLKALQATPTQITLPHPTVQPCDNLQTYTSGILMVCSF